MVWLKVGEGATRQTYEQTSNNVHTVFFMYESYDIGENHKAHCNYENNIWRRGFAIAYVFTVAVFKTQIQSPGENPNFVTFSEFLTHPRVHHTSDIMSVSSRPRVPNYAIGRDRGEE